MKRAIVYYTDSKLEEGLDLAVRRQLLKAADGIPIISVSQKPLDFGHNICVGRKPHSYTSLYEQLLIGLKECDEDAYVFTCEHDVFYNPRYFRFAPPDETLIWFNMNRYFWKLNLPTFGKAVGFRALSQGSAYRDVLIRSVEKQLEDETARAATPLLEGFDNWECIWPNIDIRHGGNFTRNNAEKRGYEYGEVIGDTKIEYWGTARNFQDRTGYKNHPSGLKEQLSERFNPKKDLPPCVVQIPDFHRADFVQLVAELELNRGAEIGVKHGRHARMLCEANPNLHLKCIDSWAPGPQIAWETAQTRYLYTVKDLADFNVDIIREDSLEAADEIPPWSLDFVYLDGGHTFNELMSDLLAYEEKVRPGGIISGHDYSPIYPGVMQAVNAYVQAHKIELFVSESTGDYPDATLTWFFVRDDL